MGLHRLLTFVFLLAVSASLQKVSLDTLSQFTVVHGGLTAGDSPVPQLECIGGSGHNLYEVRALTCHNIAGHSAYDADEINWRCEAQLPEEFQLGSTDVSCVKWKSTEAHTQGKGGGGNWIVEGSCRVEYMLMLTPLGQEKFGHLVSSPSFSSSGHAPTTKFEYFFWFLFLGVAGYIVYSVISTSRNQAERRAPPRRRRPDGRNREARASDDDDDDDDDVLPPHFYDAARNPSDGKGRENASWMPLAATGIAASGAAALATRQSGLFNRAAARPGSTTTREDFTGRESSSSTTTATTSFMNGQTFGESRTSSGFGGTSHRS